MSPATATPIIDRALYLPKIWTDDPARLKAAHVSDDVGFATKPKLAARMIGRALAAHVPFAWVAADTVYGVSEVERVLRRAGKGYVLGVTGDHLFHSWDKPQPVAGSALAIAEALQPSDWQRLSAGAGTKGPRLHDWAYLELADLEAEEFDAENPGVWTRGLLIRRHIANGDLAFFTTWCPAGTPIETLVSVEGHRWAIEDRLRDRQERAWSRSQREPLLAWLASPRLARHARLRHDGCHPPARQCHTAPKNETISRETAAPPLIRWSVQEVRRIAVRLAQRRIKPAHIIAWSLWRRAHQAAAQSAHFKSKTQL